MKSKTQRLTNTQLEIIKAFRHELTEDDLKKFRKSIADFFAEILMDEADKVWESQAWNEKKLEEMLNTKMRRRNRQEE